MISCIASMAETEYYFSVVKNELVALIKALGLPPPSQSIIHY